MSYQNCFYRRFLKLEAKAKEKLLQWKRDQTNSQKFSEYIVAEKRYYSYAQDHHLQLSD